MDKDGISIKVILLGIFIIWLAVAANYIDFPKEEATFLQHHRFARVIVVFLTVFTALHIGKHKLHSKIINSLIVTGLYYIIAEI